MELIATTSMAWGIGKKGEPLYDLPETRPFFDMATDHHNVVMGRNTFERMGYGLYHKANLIVVTGNEGFDPKMSNGLAVARATGFDDMMQILTDNGLLDNTVCIGGEKLFRACLDYCDTAYVTKVCGYDPADAFLPDLDKHPDWEKSWYKPLGQHGKLIYQTIIYENKNVKRWKPNP